MPEKTLRKLTKCNPEGCRAPKFIVENLIAEGEYLRAAGKNSMKKKGKKSVGMLLSCNQINYMDMNLKSILEKANAAITAGDNEKFLSFCTDDTLWTFVGDRTLRGKEEVRNYMLKAYIKPPKFIVENLIAEGDFLTAIGKISMKNDDGKTVDYSYCDVWRFQDGKMAELKAFVIETGSVDA